MVRKAKVAPVSKLVLWNAIVTKTHRAVNAGIDSHAFEYVLVKALYQAEGNANDTMQDAIHGGATFDDAAYEEEFASISYGSLSLTGPFDGNKQVRDFFESIGYKW